MVSLSSQSMGSAFVAWCICVNFSVENWTKSTLTLRFISSFVFLFSNRENLSARVISLPGRQMMLRSYSCRRSSIRCKRVGAAIKFFRLIIYNGLWSLSTWNLHPYKYVLNRSQPKTTARSSRSMFAYLCSVSVSALEANAIGFSFLLENCA